MGMKHDTFKRLVHRTILFNGFTKELVNQEFYQKILKYNGNSSISTASLDKIIKFFESKGLTIKIFEQHSRWNYHITQDGYTWKSWQSYNDRYFAKLNCILFILKEVKTLKTPG